MGAQWAKVSGLRLTTAANMKRWSFSCKKTSTSVSRSARVSEYGSRKTHFSWLPQDLKKYSSTHTHTRHHTHLLDVLWRSSSRPALYAAGTCVCCAGPVCGTPCHSSAWRNSCSPAGPAPPAALDTSHTYSQSGPLQQ